MALEKLMSGGDGRKIKRLQQLVGIVNTFEPELEELTDADLRARTARFRERVDDGETLDDILAPFRRPADGRHGPARRRHLRDEDR